MKVIHTADVHLDASFAAAGLPPSFGQRRRQSLREVLRAILKRAAAWPADAVLIAGDLFEHERIGRDTIAFLRDAFDSIRPIPIFIAPGNHDPYTTNSPYVAEAWPANVFIFDRPHWTSHALQRVPLTVHGFAFDGFSISDNPFGKLRVPNDGRIHIAIGHGSELEHQPPEKDVYAPFRAAECVPDGLAYLALGHFHRLTPIRGPFAATAYYSGAPEGHDFGEPGLHYYLEVEVSPGDPPSVRATPVPSSRSIYRIESLDCSEFSHGQQVLDALRGLFKPSDHDELVRIKLTGNCPASLRATFEDLPDLLMGEAAHIEVRDHTTAREDYAALAEEQTSLGAFMLRIGQEIKDCPDPERRQLLERAREVGLAAYRGLELPIRGMMGWT